MYFAELLMNSLLAAIAVSLIIFIHELGHFVCAKAVGMRVEVFSLGFWKRLVGFRIGETDYRISLIPLGGYVKVAGEGPEAAEGEPDEFWSKTPGQRALFVVGGVTMNFVLALVLFIVAFGIGVNFAVADVGDTIKRAPAWRAGIKSGDSIVRVNDVDNPVFPDLLRAVILGEGPVRLEVRRDGAVRTYILAPERDEQLGLKTIGIMPPRQPVVTGLARFEMEEGEEALAPAEEAGIRIQDEIVAIAGEPVATARDVTRELMRHPEGPVEVTVERGGERHTYTITPVAPPEYIVGISGVGTTVELLQEGGVADAVGLDLGDTVLAVGGRRTRSVVDVEDALHASLADEGETVPLTVNRGDEELELAVSMPDPVAVEDFLHSVAFAADPTLDWVLEDGPAWRAGMRPGDTIIGVGGEEVDSWSQITRAGAAAEREARPMRWRRDGEVFEAEIEPAARRPEYRRFLGVNMGWPVMKSQRFGAVAAVRRGFWNMGEKISEMLLTLKGIGTGAVSPRQMRGIVTIARASYVAATQGIGKLLYMTAVISAAIAFLNILPIPVLDGGHLLFLAIEKVRGKRLSERVMTVAQTVGFVLLILLIVYVTHNDIAQLLQG